MFVDPAGSHSVEYVICPTFDRLEYFGVYVSPIFSSSASLTSWPSCERQIITKVESSKPASGARSAATSTTLASPVPTGEGGTWASAARFAKSLKSSCGFRQDAQTSPGSARAASTTRARVGLGRDEELAADRTEPVKGDALAAAAGPWRRSA